MKTVASLLAYTGFCALVLTFAACEQADHSHATGDKPHFAYEGEHGPSHWGDLSSDWVLAKTGKSQSPIDIKSPASGEEDGLDLSYKSTPVHLVNNGHGVQVDYAKGSTLSIGGDTYSLLQFHFHTPSEHTISGRQSPMESHLVHANDTGDLAVLGVMINEGAENSFLAKFWGKLPEQPGPVQEHDDITVNVQDFLPSDLKTYRYSGSLTTPPCSENVRWILLQTPVTASKEQIRKLQTITGKNARPVQALNGRKIYSNK